MSDPFAQANPFAASFGQPPPSPPPPGPAPAPAPVPPVSTASAAVAEAAALAREDNPFQAVEPLSAASAVADNSPAWAQGEVAADLGRASSLDSREVAVSQREAALAEKEKELRDREALEERERRLLLPDGRRKNFPRCYPLFRHDIAEDVPEANRPMVRCFFVVWALAAGGYAFNALIVFLGLFAGYYSFWQTLLALMAAVVGEYAAWHFWYSGGIYKAAQTNGATVPYVLFFANFFFHCAWAWIVFLSPPLVGSMNAGLLRMIEFFSKVRGGDSGINHGLWGGRGLTRCPTRVTTQGGAGIFFGILAIINTVAWGACAGLSLYALRWAFYTFRVAGGVTAMEQAGDTFAKAGAYFSQRGEVAPSNPLANPFAGSGRP